MVLPTQATFGLAATNLMQSMLDGIEERRKQDEEKATGEKRDPVVEARISAGVEAKRAREKIAEALFGSANPDPVELKLQLVDRLARDLGIDTDEARSAYRLGRVLEEALKTMAPDEVRDLSEKIGLSDLGVSMDTLLSAIKNPYGDDNERLKEALIKKANGGKLDAEMRRIVQRLEDVSDPKTLEELKLGPQGYDPTRIEDAETQEERREDIRALEASEKLEDVQAMQDAVKERNDKITQPAAAGETQPASDTVDADIIAVLGAAVEQTREAQPAGDEAASEPSGDASEATETIVPPDPTKITEANAEIIEAAVAAEELARAQLAILPVSIDEIGLYKFLKDKLAA